MELSILRKSACPRTIVSDHAAIQPSSLPAPIIGLVLFFCRRRSYHVLLCFIIDMNDKIHGQIRIFFHPFFRPGISWSRQILSTPSRWNYTSIDVSIHDAKYPTCNGLRALGYTKFQFVYPAIFGWSYTVYNIHVTYLGFKILHCDLGGARRLSSNIHWRTWSGDELRKQQALVVATQPESVGTSRWSHCCHKACASQTWWAELAGAPRQALFLPCLINGQLAKISLQKT